MLIIALGCSRLRLLQSLSCNDGMGIDAVTVSKFLKRLVVVVVAWRQWHVECCEDGMDIDSYAWVQLERGMGTTKVQTTGMDYMTCERRVGGELQ